MTQPLREELPNDLEHLTNLLDGAWPSGHKAMAASIIAAGYSRAGSAQALPNPPPSGLGVVKAHGLKTCLDETGLQVTAELYKAVNDLKGASPCLLAMIGSWGDTLDDIDILGGLKRQNEMGECLIPEAAVTRPNQREGT